MERRIAELKAFVEEVKPGLEYRVVPIYDGAGPTILPSDPEMDLIVLSQETRNGGEMINTEREKKVGSVILGYKALKVKAYLNAVSVSQAKTM